MNVDGGVQLGTALIQVDNGLYGERPSALSSVEGEVPSLTARILTLEPERTSEQDPERAVSAQLGECAVCYFSQVDAIVEGVPCTLLVVRPPRLLKNLTDALSLLPLHPIASWDAWCAWDTIGPRVTVSSRSPSWTLHATAKLISVRILSVSSISHLFHSIKR